jgi:hypothetical protein
LLYRLAGALDQGGDAMLSSVGKCAAELGRYSADRRRSLGRPHIARHVTRQERDQSPQCVRIAGAGFRDSAIHQRAIARN